jgi:multidrug efflux pump subunit AcrB
VKLAEWSVKNSLLVNLMTVFILLAGIMAVFSLKREAFPNINFDIVEIRTNYPGSTPEQIEKLITIPIEKELNEVSDIKEMVSASAEGISLIFLTIEPDAANKPKIVNEIQRAVDRVEDLPDDLEDQPIVREMLTKDAPVLEVSLYGELAPEELRRQAKRLEDRILELPEVSNVVRRGYRELEFSVEVAPQKMWDLHVSLPEVMAALKKTNVNIPGGKIQVGDQEVLLRVSGEFHGADRIEDVFIRGNDRGYGIRVKDVAQVRPTLGEITVTNRANGAEAINLMVLKKPKGDIIDLVEEIHQVTEDFLATAPRGAKITVVNDISYYVKRRLNVLINNGLIGLAFLVIPLLVFFTPRTAASALLGIFTAVAATFAMMDAFGMTINLMSLFGMIMVLGMLVDEDIVVSENVHRYMEMGMGSREAAIKGASQVGKAVVATVLTTITSFIPLLLMTGIIGKFVEQIPLVVIITLSASLLQALVMLPAHLADFNNMTEAEAQRHFRARKNPWLYNAILSIYERILRFLIRFRYATLLVFLLITAGVTALWHYKVPFILFPKTGIEQFFIRVEGEVGTPVGVTTEKMKGIEKILSTKLGRDELDQFVNQGGMIQNDINDPFTQRGSHVGQVWVFLTPEASRNRDADAIIESIRPEIEKIPGFKRVWFEHVRPGPPVGKPIAVRIKGQDFDQLNRLAAEYIQVLGGTPGVKDIKSDFDRGKDELRVVLDESLMSQAGLSYQEVAAAVRIGFDGGVATTIKEGDEEIDVVVRFPPGLAKDQKTLDQLLISNSRGDLIPLKAIAAFERQPSIAVIKHDDRKRLVTVTANVDEKVTTSAKVNEQLEERFRARMVDYPGVMVDYSGEQEDTEESLASLRSAFILAIFLTFIILAVTFRSLWEPFIILTTIPMGIMGVVLAFYISHQPLTFLAMLGVVGFSGVVVDSGIILIDFINWERREQGISPTEAIISGSKIRLRAIFLTTITTVFGVLPAAFGIGGRDPFIQPMAQALNWGITSGSLLAIFIIPVLLAIFGDFFKRFYFRNKQA